MYKTTLDPNKYPNIDPSVIEKRLDGLPAVKSVTRNEKGEFVIAYDTEDMEEFLSFQYPSIIQKLAKENHALENADKPTPQPNRVTVVVNMFGGPGSGKTTAAHEVYAELSKRGYLVEYAPEYAKELAWAIDNPNCSIEEQASARSALDGSLKHQVGIYEEQKRRVDKLIGLVDFVITDSPAILSCIYLKETNTPAAWGFESRALEDFIKQDNFNMVVSREGAYEQKGRVHDADAAKKIDEQIEQFFKSHNIYHGTYSRDKIEVAIKNMQKTLNRTKRNQTLRARNRFPHPDEFEQRGGNTWVWMLENVSDSMKDHHALRDVVIACHQEGGWTCSCNMGVRSKLSFGESAAEAYENCFKLTALAYLEDTGNQLTVINPESGIAYKLDDPETHTQVRMWSEKVFESNSRQSDNAEKRASAPMAAPIKNLEQPSRKGGVR